MQEAITLGNHANPITFTDQLAAAFGPLAIRFSRTSDSLRLYDADGWTLTASGEKAGVDLFTALNGRKVWSEDAAQLDRDHGEFLTALGHPRIHCARTLDRALAPAKQKPAPEPGRALAQLLRAHGVAPLRHRIIANQLEADDASWRKVAARGYLIDGHALARERQRHTGVVDALARREGGVEIRTLNPHAREAAKVNFARNEAKAAWLSARNIGFSRSRGEKWAEPSNCDRSVMPTEFIPEWTEYDLAYQSLHRLVPLNSLARAIDSDGRARPLYRTNAAVTGRMSAQVFAIQNMPSKRQSIRHVVLAEPGTDVVSVDHSNAELRVLARFIGDQAFTERVMKGDLYQEVADYVGVTRSEAKWQAIAYMYAMRETTLARDTSKLHAAKMHEAFRVVVPEIPAFLSEMTSRSRSGERFETLFGRPLPLLDGGTFETRHELAVNLVVQGSARDAWGIGCRQAETALGWEAMWVPLHDELFVLSPAGESMQTVKTLLEAMTIDLGGGVVLSGKAKTTYNRWG